ncbi:MAG: outer membrane beta-barrel protein [Chitinophagales bacterium]
MKQSQNNNFDQFIKGKLENASVEPPAFIWNKIERKLPPVLPWYSKYKYLLLLLLLCFTSATSVLTYKHFKNEHKQENLTSVIADANSNSGENVVAQTDENGNNKNKQESTTDENGMTANDADKEKNTPSVNSFYKRKEKTASASAVKNNASASAVEKRNERISRFAATTKNIMNVSTATALSQNNTNTGTETESDSKLKAVRSKNKPGNNSNKKDGIDNSASINATAVNDNSLDLNAVNSNTNTIANNQSTEINSVDISPIAEPVRPNKSEELLVSVTPLKINTTPLQSREVLQSLIDPTKLSAMDFEAAAGVEELNPNKEKMMRNLKQFAGYNINQGFHIGAFISINNIWLSNRSFSCGENVSSIKPKIDFGKSYGLNIGYDYTDHWGIELEAQYAEQGQKYTETSVNMNSTREVNLNYLKFPLMVKYKQSFINNYNSKPIVMSFLFGPQMGFLLKKETLLNGKPTECKQGYSKVETGLAVGLDFDLYMMRYMYLTIGARTGFGTSFKKGVPVSYQLGITTQFNFRIPKKIK